METVGPLFSGWHLGDVYGEPAERKGEDVHEDMGGVGHQREAVREPAADELGQKDDGGKGDRKLQTPLESRVYIGPVAVLLICFHAVLAHITR